MSLPFTGDQFLEVFRRYNEAVWPAQWALVIAALVIVRSVLAPSRWRGRLAIALLASLWAWAAIVYHLAFFRSINPIATAFAALFLAQTLLLGRYALNVNAPELHARGGIARWVGAALVVSALVVYPMLSIASGHRFPASPTFGLPCPLTVFTFGVLMWWQPRVPISVAVIPVLWAIIGSTAAIQLGMTEDVLLPLSLVVAAPLLIRRAVMHRRDALRRATRLASE